MLTNVIKMKYDLSNVEIVLFQLVINNMNKQTLY